MADKTAQIPKHVAIIMDGNGRWAKKRLMPRTYGHKKGVEATKRAISFYAKAGVSQLTLFAFSSENWNRPKDEVSTLMSLFVSSLQKNTQELHANSIKIRFIGDRSAFSQKLISQIQESEKITRNNTAMTLNVAANYGGQWDILQAVQKLSVKIENAELKASELSAELIADELSLAGSPDPDLFIRTGGEKRISNFLLWQIAYAELFFTDVLWPDFKVETMQESLHVFASRQRRFGKTSEQIDPDIKTVE